MRKEELWSKFVTKVIEGSPLNTNPKLNKWRKFDYTNHSAVIFTRYIRSLIIILAGIATIPIIFCLGSFSLSVISFTFSYLFNIIIIVIEPEDILLCMALGMLLSWSAAVFGTLAILLIVTDKIFYLVLHFFFFVFVWQKTR
jgi:hypothetical protein